MIDERFLLLYAVGEDGFHALARQRPIDVSIAGTTYWFRFQAAETIKDDADLHRLDEIVRWLKSDSIESRALATRGQDMVRSFHNVSRRVDQILQAAAAPAAGKLTGMRWDDANPILNLSDGPRRLMREKPDTDMARLVTSPGGSLG